MSACFDTYAHRAAIRQGRRLGRIVTISMSRGEQVQALVIFNHQVALFGTDGELLEYREAVAVPTLQCDIRLHLSRGDRIAADGESWVLRKELLTSDAYMSRWAVSKTT